MAAYSNSIYYLGNCLEGLNKTTINLNHDSSSPGEDFNPKQA